MGLLDRCKRRELIGDVVDNLPPQKYRSSCLESIFAILFHHCGQILGGDNVSSSSVSIIPCEMLEHRAVCVWAGENVQYI